MSMMENQRQDDLDDESLSGTPNLDIQPKERVTLSSSVSTIVTLLGLSVATSDFWRFPFLVYRNGGGAFLIPFAIVILLCGIPLYLLEYSVSKFSGKGPYGIWDICPLFRGTAHSIFIGYGIWNIYISVYRAWITEFLVQSFQSTLPWSHCQNVWNTPSCREYVVADEAHIPYVQTNSTLIDANVETLINSTKGAYSMYLNTSVFNTTEEGLHEFGMSAAEEFWQFRVLKLSSGIDNFGTFQWKYALYHIAARVLVVVCCYKSIKSIEKVMYVSLIGPLLIIVAILIRSLTLPGALEGISLFFHCDFTKLQEPRIWIEAAIMAFYTLGFGWGGVVMLGSHSKFKENPIRVAATVSILDAVMATFNGMVCFSVLGTMAHTKGTPVNRVVNAGLSVGMVTYPSAIAELPSPQIWSVFFFVGLILQGLDGQMVTVEMSVEIIKDTFPQKFANRRLFLLLLINVGYFLLSLPICTQAGGYIFLLLDWYSGVWLGPIIALIELLVILWVYGGDRFSHDVSLMIGIELPAVFRICLAFIAPVIVLTLMLVSMVEYSPPKYGNYQYSAVAQLCGWLILATTFIPTLAYVVKFAVNGQRGILTNLRDSLRPLQSWGPVEYTVSDSYDRRPPPRTFVDVLKFNIFGETKSERKLVVKEMDRLYKNGDEKKI